MTSLGVGGGADPLVHDAGTATGVHDGAPHRRSAPVWAAVLAIVALGMAYSLLRGPLVDHQAVLVTPGDIWSTFRVSQLITWGGGKLIYQGGLIVVPPALALLLTPVAALATALHLSESFPLTLPDPTAWYVVGPVELVLGALVLFPLDAWARRLGVGGRRRIALLCLEVLAVVPVVGVWGHPEDLLGLGCALYGLMAARDGRFGRSAWWVGAAVAFQPLALLLVPLALASVPARRWARYCLTGALPTLALIVAPLISDPRATVRALVDQPSFPARLWPTPWIHLAPVIGHTHKSLFSTQYSAHTIVAAGPARLFAVAVAVAVAVFAGRRRVDDVTLLWLAALCMAARCIFDAVLCPYYVVPAIAVAIVAAAGSGGRRLAVTSIFCVGPAAFAYTRGPLWAWYLEFCALLLVAVGSAVPASVERSGRPVGSDLGGPAAELGPDDVPGGVLVPT